MHEEAAKTRVAPAQRWPSLGLLTGLGIALGCGCPSGAPTHVGIAAPADLAYSSNPAVYTLGQTITNDVPSNAGGPVSTYVITPEPPAGLLFAAATGVLSGVPRAVTRATAYSVTGANASGSATVTLSITVNDVPPSALVYTMNPATYTVGRAITDNTPTSQGGTVVSYSITPGLSGGLNFSTATGVISGTPSVIATSMVYVVTATNSGGATTASLTIEVDDLPPASLSYSTNPAMYTIGQTITDNTPTISGGAAVAYSIAPHLPGGLALNSTNGIISGTPSVVSSSTVYTVTAANSGGSTTAKLVLGVNDLPPAGLTYATNPAVYIVGQTIMDKVPTSSGGAVIGYRVTPALPAGLSLGTTSGVISGTPTQSAAMAVYTVTASNSGGSTTASLTIGVVPGGVTTGMLGVIASGAYHACAIASGGVQCWGDNSKGQLGNGTANSSIPLQVSGLTSGAQAVTAGSYHTCAIVNGGVACWGSNNNGQLGNGTTTYSAVPVQVAGLTSGAQLISASGNHTCALVNGGIQCWGSNASGELGNGATTDSDVPVAAVGLTSGVQGVAAGASHTCAMLNGGVQCWGANASGQLGNNSTTDSNVAVSVAGLMSGVQAIAAGASHTCALVNGGVQCWGDNTSGELGNGSTTSSPVPVPSIMSGVQAIAVGAYYSCAVTNGTALCWGADDDGQLGNGAGVDSGVPIQISGLAGVQEIVTGEHQACALVNGGVQCWGDEYYGQMGNSLTGTNPSMPVQVIGLTDGVQSLVVGSSCSCALVNGGGQCWGGNYYGGLGDNSTTNSPVPIQAIGIASRASALAAGEFHVCAVVGGAAQCWGDNMFGQLGDGSTADSNVAVAVTGMTNGTQTVSAGGAHTCAILNGGIWCWGAGGQGELGNADLNDYHLPVGVSGLTSGADAVAASVGSFTCALVSGGVWCWGSNAFGELGTSDMTECQCISTLCNCGSPLQVSGLSTGVQAITAGAGHACTIVNGGVECWGWNNNGQLGNDSTIDSVVPVPVLGLTSGVQSVAAGTAHTCAIMNGGAQCWGDNYYGQLGNNSTTSSSVPVQVFGLQSGVEAIAAGDGDSCALVNGNVLCWGANPEGELGNGTTVSSLVPVPIGPWAQ